jgi:hypothetical protein
MARLGVMCLSVQADIDRKWEHTVLRCRNHGSVNKGYCLAERQMPLLERTL